MEKLDELKFRKALAAAVVKLLQEDEEMKSDPRQPEALAEYTRQLASIDKKIQELEGPQDIVIGLKPASLFGQVPGG